MKKYCEMDVASDLCSAGLNISERVRRALRYLAGRRARDPKSHTLQAYQQTLLKRLKSPPELEIRVVTRLEIRRSCSMINCTSLGCRSTLYPNDTLESNYSNNAASLFTTAGPQRSANNLLISLTPSKPSKHVGGTTNVSLVCL